MNLETLQELGRVSYFGNELSAWAKAFATFAVWFTVLPIARAFIANRLRKRTADHPVAFLLLFRTLIDATTRLFILAIAIYLALRWLRIPQRLDRAIDVAILVIVWWQVGYWLSAAVRHLIDTRRGHELVGAEGAATLNILRFLGIVIAWVVAFLMLLANLRIEIMPLVAGLGIGGIAIALAVQNVLGDLFASLSIALDKPFRVGDSLAVGDERGTVEAIGIKSTRLRSITGEQIIVSNGDLLKSRLRNYSQLTQRRAELQLRIAYETPRQLIAGLPKIIENAIRAEGNVRFERAHFTRYGNDALLFEATYVVENADLLAFMDAQQSINLRLLDELGRRGILLAFPVRGAPPPAPAAAEPA